MLSPDLLTLWTRQVLEAAHRGDEALVDDVAQQIADRADALDLLASCRVIADEALRALLVLYRRPDPARGEAWVLDQLGDAEGSPALLFAARLVTSYANHDHDHVTALVAAAAGASREERAESLRALVTYAAGLDARAARRINPTEGNDR